MRCLRTHTHTHIYIYIKLSCNTKPARSIGNYFVSKSFHDCIIFYTIVSKSDCLLVLCYNYLHVLRASMRRVHHTVQALKQLIHLTVITHYTSDLTITTPITTRLDSAMVRCLSASHCGIWCFIQGYSMLDLWYIQWQWDTFFSNYFSCPLSASLYQCSIFIHSTITSATYPLQETAPFNDTLKKSPPQ